MFKVAAFYKFVPVHDISITRERIMDHAKEIKEICGTILIASEGINATIAAYNLDPFIDFLDAELGIKSGELKYSISSEKPFYKFKVRLKKEIITLKQSYSDPNKVSGTYVEPSEWNALISDPDVTLIDTRNYYETKIGVFKDALDPQLDVFSEFPEWAQNKLNPKKHKKIAMFCTGGIRCEKASSYLKQTGFEEVYHLKGGILKYLETVPANKSLWEGECFVFDKRVAVKHGLEEGSSDVCYNCQTTLTDKELEMPSYQKGVSCEYCYNELTPSKIKSLRQRHNYYKSTAIKK